jgi:hypothetical protein
LLPGVAFAVTGVSPKGVNVNATGVTSVFLTFQNLAGNERPIAAFWCSELTVSGGPSFVTAFDPCVPGTILGQLPVRNDLSTVSGAGTIRNFTDVMTIPASVARRADQSARSGDPAPFFYVRQFSDGKVDTYVAITCRLTSGGARAPLALTEVRLLFDTPQGQRPVTFIGRGEPLPSFAAEVDYNGAGRLTGRWELVKPGDPEPTPEDLLPEASLPVERRGLQQRYTLIGRFDVFLQPGRSTKIPGPDPTRVAADSDGSYRILLRVEATLEREGDSDTLGGVVPAGGVAGFPMPALAFTVGAPETVMPSQAPANPGKLVALLPRDGAEVAAGSPVHFSWSRLPGAAAYRLEIRSNAAVVLNAAVAAGAGSYTSPPWALAEADLTLQWRVVAVDANARTMVRSDWRRLRTTGP